MLFSRKAFFPMFTCPPEMECKYASVCSPWGKVGCGAVSEHLRNARFSSALVALRSPRILLSSLIVQIRREAKSHTKLGVFKKVVNCLCVMIRM